MTLEQAGKNLQDFWRFQSCVQVFNMAPSERCSNVMGRSTHYFIIINAILFIQNINTISMLEYFEGQRSKYINGIKLFYGTAFAVLQNTQNPSKQQKNLQNEASTHNIYYIPYQLKIFEKMSKLKLIRSDKLSVKKFKSMMDLQRSTCPNDNRSRR